MLVPILPGMSEVDQSTKLFNTAVIATKIPQLTDYSTQLSELVTSKAFQSILKSIREYSVAMGVPEEQAAEDVVQCFRTIDKIWDSYIFQEGLDKLKGHLSN